MVHQAGRLCGQVLDPVGRSWGVGRCHTPRRECDDLIARLQQGRAQLDGIPAERRHPTRPDEHNGLAVPAHLVGDPHTVEGEDVHVSLLTVCWPPRRCWEEVLRAPRSGAKPGFSVGPGIPRPAAAGSTALKARDVQPFADFRNPTRTAVVTVPALWDGGLQGETVVLGCPAVARAARWAPAPPQSRARPVVGSRRGRRGTGRWPTRW
jgi:hypothetical protein